MQARVLIIRVGRLGDTVMATNIIEPLLNYYGDNARIDWVAGSGAPSAILKIDKRLHRIFSLKHRKAPLWLDPVKRELRRLSVKTPYDMVINLEFGDTCDELASVIQAGDNLGRPYFIYRADKNAHGADQMKVFYRDFLGPAWVDHAIPKIVPSPDLEPLPEPLETTDFIMLHPGFSAVRKKNYRLNKAWPERHWKTLISEITKTHVVVITGTKQEQPYLQDLMELENTHPFIGRSLRQLTTAMLKAKCVISVDTGTMHLSAALGAPTIALFGPTDPALTGPHPAGKNVITLASDIECRPCYGTPLRKICTFNRCMHELKPQRILYELKRTLQDNQLTRE